MITCVLIVRWQTMEACHMAEATATMIIHRHSRKCPILGKKDNAVKTCVWIAFYFVWDNRGEPVPEETFTHSHLLWSTVIPYKLHPSVTIHGILPVQCTCLTVFIHSFCPSFLLSTSWPDTLHFILHTFLHPIVVFFLQHMPITSQPVLL